MQVHEATSTFLLPIAHKSSKCTISHSHVGVTCEAHTNLNSLRLNCAQHGTPVVHCGIPPSVQVAILPVVRPPGSLHLTKLPLHVG